MIPHNERIKDIYKSFHPMAPVPLQIVGYWCYNFSHKRPLLLYNIHIDIEKYTNYIMKKDKNMKNKEPKLNEV